MYKFLSGNVLAQRNAALVLMCCLAEEKVLGNRKSLELIMTKVCSLLGGETTGSQDISEIKVEKKRRPGTKRDRETSRQKCNFFSNCSLPETIKGEWKQD